MTSRQARETGGKILKEQWGPALLVLLLAYTALGVAAVFGAGFGALVVLGPASVGILYVYEQAFLGNAINYKDLLYGVRNNFGEIVLGSLLKLAFLAGVLVAAYGIIATFTALLSFVQALAIVLDVLSGIVAIVAMIIVALRLALVEYILMREPETKGWDAVKKSKQMMEGYTGKLFRFNISFLGWFVLTAIFFPLAVYTAPYYQLSRVCLLGSIYEEAIRREEEMEAAAASSAETKFCKSCGAEIAEDSAFCPRCGKEQ